MKLLIRGVLRFFLLALIIVIPVGCELILSIFPEESLVEEYIDPLGGTLSAAGIELEVPTGCFTDTELIRILLNEEETPYDEVTHTGKFAIEGLPNNYSEPIMVKLAYTTEPTEYPYIMVSMDYFGMDMEEGQLSYFAMEATDSSGYLTIFLPPYDQGLSMTRQAKDGSQDLLVPNKIFVLGFFSKTKNLYSSKKNFKISWPYNDENPEQLNTAIVALEDALTYFTSNPAYDISRRTRWPIEVTISKANSDAKAWCSPSPFGLNYMSMGIHPDFLTDGDPVNVRSTMFHEVFHLVQNLNHPGSSVTWHRFNVVADSYHTFDMFCEASSLWANTLIPEAYDLAWKHDPSASFNGFKVGAKGSLQKSKHHGYGMGPVVIYLVDKYGPTFLWETWNDIRDGTSVFRALLSNIDYPFTWLPDYYETFFLAYVNRYPNLFFYPHETFTIKKGKEEYSKIYDYPAMSGRYYDIGLDQDFDPSSKLTIRLLDGDPVNDYISVLTHKDLQGFEKLISGGLSVSVSDLKKIKSEGKDLMAIVSHCTAVYPYEDSSPITMEIKLEKQEFAYINFESSLLGFWDGVLADGQEVHDYKQGIWGKTPVFVSEGIYEYIPTIEKTGNTFIQSWDFNTDEIHYKGSLTVTFDEDQRRIVSFDLILEHSHSRGSLKNRIASTNCSIKKEYNYSGMDWELWGPSLCPALTTVEEENVFENGETLTLQRHECYEESYVAFEFVR